MVWSFLLFEGFGIWKTCIDLKYGKLPEVVGRAGVKINPYKIDEIAFGFKTLEEQYLEYVQNIPEQLAKFSPIKSTESFMDALRINYKPYSCMNM